MYQELFLKLYDKTGAHLLLTINGRKGFGEQMEGQSYTNIYLPNSVHRFVLQKAIEIIGTHEEGENLRYCDTGEDMELACRSECVDMAIGRLKRFIENNHDKN